MARNKTIQKKKTFILCILTILALCLLMVRLGFLMLFCSAHYTKLADMLHERERDIKAARGRIIDSTGSILADNRTVCTISVIHSQIEDAETVIEVLSRELGLSQEYVRKRVEKYSAREKIKSNVDKEIGDKIRNLDMAGVKVDEDYKRYYPYGELASKVLGFTGADNQGIVGLEVKYEKYLTGQNGQILTLTDAKGIELDGMGEKRKEPIAGSDLYVSLDVNIQKYATQLARQAYETKQAQGVSIIVMNVRNGEILAMTDVPEFDLNEPYTLIPEMTAQTGDEPLSSEQKQELLNAMWRNGCINDTYEPGSTFKIITAAAGLEAGVVTLEDRFSCSGAIIVDDRRIRCHKAGGHGAESFTDAVKNSCNPAFITVGLRLGPQRYYDYFTKFCMKQKTGIDLPGEAATIMHQLDKIGEVELATISFGQSFQLSPIRILTTISAVINGGTMITPHFGVSISDTETQKKINIRYTSKKNVISKETSDVMKNVLETVVSEGGGKKAAIEGYKVGAKTGTSEKLPRRSGKYIASCMGFAPAQNPKVIALVLIDEPSGIYYGGTIAAPVISKLLDDILPYVDGKEDYGYSGN